MEQIFAIKHINITNKCNGKCEKVDKDKLLNESEKNWGKIVCRRCGSIFFPEDVVEYVEGQPHDLRIMTHQGAGKPGTERISWWWYTNDDMDFDTIGWQTIEKKKLLMCADCEFGPVGYRSPDDKQFWVAVERVRYLPPSDSASGSAE